MNNDDLEHEVKKLARRLQRLERHVGLEWTEPPPAVSKTANQGLPVRDGGSPASLAAPTMATISDSPPQPLAPPTAPALKPVPPRPAQQSAPPPVRTAPTSAAGQRSTAASNPARGLVESFIGIKGLGAIGAIFVIIGAGFFAREYGANFWFSLSAAVQAFAIACFGGLLLLCGELALRKLGRPASLGLYSAGLGVLYMDAFATFEWFQIVSREASFLLMGIVAVLGFAITLRSRFLSIGVLSLIGGYLAPILLRSAGAGGIAVMAFLTMLAGIALALSAWQPRPFRPLRYVAFGGQALLGLIVILAHATAQPMMILIFISIWWTMFLAEAVLAAMRRQSSTGNVVVTLLGTAAFVTCASWILNTFTTVGSEYLGAFTAMIAILSGAVALQFGPGLDGLRGRLDTAMDKLSAALWAQMGVLIVVAIAMQFDGYGASVGWLALALASIEIGRRLPSSGTTVFGLVVLGLGILRVTVLDQLNPSLRALIWSAGELRIDQWAILGLLTVLTIHAAARRVGGRTPALERSVPVLLAILGAVAWFVLIMRQAEGLTLTALWLGGALAMLACEQWSRRERYLEISLLMLLAVAAKWLLFDAIGRRVAPGWDAGQWAPLLNPQMALAVAIAFAGWWGFRRIDLRGRIASNVTRSPHVAWQIAAIIGGVFLLLGLSFEVDRGVVLFAQARESLAWAEGHVRQLFFTMLWAMGSAGFGVLAMALQREWAGSKPGAMPVVLRFAWGVLAACAVKWIVVDTLHYALTIDRTHVLTVSPIGNLQMLAVGLLAGVALFLLHVTSRVCATDTDEPRTGWAFLRGIAPVGVCILMLWGLTFEVDRMLGRMELAGAVSLWTPEQVRAFWWAMLWAGGGALMMPLGWWRGVREMCSAGWAIVIFSAVFWMVFGAIIWRLNSGPAATTIFLNLHFLSGLAVLGMLTVTLWLRRCAIEQLRLHLVPVTLAIIAVLGFVLGSLEVDRGWMSNEMAKQMGLSIYWALYGVVLILAGFLRLSAPCRYVGLVLLSLTVMKIVLIDMATVDQVWRVLSFIVSGLLLIGTSMAYAKLSPKILMTFSSRAHTST